MSEPPIPIADPLSGGRGPRGSTENRPAAGVVHPPRSLGRLAVAALGVNCVVGSGIFLLPGPVAEGLGPAALLATVGAGLFACLIALCFAAAASRVRETGGAYLYAREAFGPLVGFEVGWISALAGVVAWGALVNGFAVALGRLIPAVATDLGRNLTIVAFLALLAWLNVLGARSGGRLSSLVSGIKLLTLLGFAAAGAFFVEPAHFQPFFAHGAGDGLAALPGAILLMLYAYVGFENLVVPAGEMERPERSLPLAIVGVLATVTVLYVGVTAVVAGTLEPVAGVENAVAASAQAALGPTGGGLVAVGVVISIFGVNAASALILPRRLSALADRGDLPVVVGRLHRLHGTPWVAILLSYGLAGTVALSGTFAELAVLAVIGRLMQYIPTCLAVLVFRARDRQRRAAGAPAAELRLPGGPTIPLVALALSAALLLQATAAQLTAGAVAAAAGLPVFWWLKRRGPTGLPPDRRPGSGNGTEEDRRRTP